MAKYYIGIREVHVSTVFVEADSEEEALDKAAEGESEEVMLEYSHTMDREHFTIDRVTHDLDCTCDAHYDARLERP
jgi:hypothetical protein